MDRLWLGAAFVLAAQWGGAWALPAAVVIPEEPPQHQVAAMPASEPPALGLAPVPGGRSVPVRGSLVTSESFELGQIPATPEDLQNRPVESYRPVVLALLITAALPLAMLGHSWWIQKQITARR